MKQIHLATIPLRDRHGRTRAVAIVDPERVDELRQHRWSLALTGHAVRNERAAGRAKTILMHRQLLGLEAGGPPRVEHRNGDPLDNRVENLTVSKRWLGNLAASDPALLDLALRLRSNRPITGEGA